MSALHLPRKTQQLLMRLLPPLLLTEESVD